MVTLKLTILCFTLICFYGTYAKQAHRKASEDDFLQKKNIYAFLEKRPVFLKLLKLFIYTNSTEEAYKVIQKIEDMMSYLLNYHFKDRKIKVTPLSQNDSRFKRSPGEDPQTRAPLPKTGLLQRFTWIFSKPWNSYKNLQKKVKYTVLNFFKNHFFPNTTQNNTGAQTDLNII
ncbi:uncharacterized protein LOC115875951 [Sitophilus oryzae]|uniref:Uncharacterized protein LOC115875951 n=1 Tax=Sitophilus oryzae TaxID=7048 RepID=A0A6J2X857_SITOR|nr:uncharacterized protein LOC115875951 [Sitophilus oryzae]